VELPPWRGGIVGGIDDAAGGEEQDGYEQLQELARRWHCADARIEAGRACGGGGSEERKLRVYDVVWVIDRQISPEVRYMETECFGFVLSLPLSAAVLSSYFAFWLADLLLLISTLTTESWSGCAVCVRESGGWLELAWFKYSHILAFLAVQ
jgi:hypothetical protein